LFSQGELLRALGGVKASATLLGVPLGHNSSFLQGPAFAPPRIREAIWCGSTNSSTEEGCENSLSLFFILLIVGLFLKGSDLIDDGEN